MNRRNTVVVLLLLTGCSDPTPAEPAPADPAPADPAPKKATEAREEPKAERPNERPKRGMPVKRARTPEDLCAERPGQNVVDEDFRFLVAGRCEGAKPAGAWTVESKRVGIRTIPFANGARHGDEVVVDGAGNKIEVTRWVGGDKRKLTKWWPNGAMHQEYGYEGGRMSGEYRSWHENGKPSCFGPAYKDGSPFEGPRRCWAEDGTLTSDEVYAAGKRVSRISTPYEDKRIKVIERIDPETGKRTTERELNGHDPTSPLSPLVKLSDLTVDELVQALENPNPQIPGNAANFLSRRGEEAVGPLTKATRAESENVRVHASQALIRIGTDAAIRAAYPELARQLDHEKNQRGSQAFFRLKKPKVHGVIVSMVKQDRRTHVPRLKRALSSEMMYARAHASMVLGDLGDRSQLSALRALQARETNGFVRKLVDGAVAKLGG
jgi:hypothetical protein